ncbi:hypothetical protein ZIOFF_062973 [Zingiber officinale]|uniref:Uncharacterized protein n=1 Tax=Zingiber officinale TaxID=94328 RepID=A0A8J5F608_ZINOF|nr:hypothetical protein ZIOFF_062973 [Zingiber officinale]
MVMRRDPHIYYDIRNWIFHVMMRALEEEKVGLASFHLEGDVQLWFIKLERDRPHIQWEEFKDQCNLRFGPSIRNNKLGELAKLQQSGSVEDYQRKFEQLAARASSLISEQVVQIFISGLQDHIAVEVELHHPEDLTSAMSFARLYERRSKRFESTVTPRRTPVLPPKQPFIKRLNRTEMEERRAKGLCFNCDELYIPDHRCKRLFWLEGLEDYDEQNHVEDVEISLNVITGIRASQTMRIQGRINHTPLLVLIDPGIANGRQLQCLGICHNVLIHLDDHKFNVEFFILPLGDIGAVLRVNWLCTLGPILWDFSQMCMSFQHTDNTIYLQGSGATLTAEVTSLAIGTLPKVHEKRHIIEKYAAIFEEPNDLPPFRKCYQPYRGVAIDNGKIEAILYWPQPTTLRALHGFLGLTGYYCKFVEGYGQLAPPLTSFLRRNSFEWNEAAELTFQKLKITLTSTLVLALPDFSKPFVVDCDASNMGIGAILQQEGRPIVFLVVLWPNDTRSSLFMRNNSSDWPKLYVIGMLIFGDTSRAGQNNVVADALSRRDNNNGQLTAIFMAKLNLTEDIQSEYSTSSEIQHLIQVS